MEFIKISRIDSNNQCKQDYIEHKIKSKRIRKANTRYIVVRRNQTYVHSFKLSSLEYFTNTWLTKPQPNFSSQYQ